MCHTAAASVSITTHHTTSASFTDATVPTYLLTYGASIALGLLPFRFSTADVRLLTWADRTPFPITTRETGNTSAMTSDPIGNTRRRSRWIGNG